LVLSEDMRQGLLAAGCPAEKLVVHHLGVDCSQFELYERGVERGLVRFLIVANLVKKKGISVAVAAFAKLAEERDKIHLEILGRGPLESALRLQVNALGIAKQVSFINNYEDPDPRGQVVRSMREADIFLLPGITAPGDYGGTPIVLMEAGAIGLPTIATANAGNSEVVRDGVTGMIVPENNVEAFYVAMKRLADAPSTRQEFGLAARAFILKEFNEVEQIQRLARFYKDVVGCLN